MRTLTTTMLVIIVVWTASDCGVATGWAAPMGPAQPYSEAGGGVQKMVLRGAQQENGPAGRVAIICCDPLGRMRLGPGQPVTPVNPGVQASMQALEDCMVSLVGLKREMHRARDILESSTEAEHSQMRALFEESLDRQEDYLNQTITLYNTLLRTLSALFEELHEEAPSR